MNDKMPPGMILKFDCAWPIGLQAFTVPVHPQKGKAGRCQWSAQSASHSRINHFAWKRLKRIAAACRGNFIKKNKRTGRSLLFYLIPAKFEIGRPA